MIDTYGSEVKTLAFGLRRAIRWYFTVADVKSAIIGADLLAHYDLLIDLKNKRLIDQNVPTQYSHIRSTASRNRSASSRVRGDHDAEEPDQQQDIASSDALHRNDWTSSH